MGSQERAQPQPGAVEVHAHGFGRQIENLGDLLGRTPFHFAQLEDGPLYRSQSFEGPLEGLTRLGSEQQLVRRPGPGGGLREPVVFGTQLGRVGVELALPTAFSEQVDRLGEDDPVQPGRWTGLTPEGVDAFERRREGLLYGVTREILVPRDPQRQRVQAVAILDERALEVLAYRVAQGATASGV